MKIYSVNFLEQPMGNIKWSKAGYQWKLKESQYFLLLFSFICLDISLFSITVWSAWKWSDMIDETINKVTVTKKKDVHPDEN